MAKNPKEGKLLYHITALNNLPSILENRLLPREKIDFDYKNVADEQILTKREKFKLESFTPFHFFASTPFSGKVQMVHPKEEFIYICLNRSTAKKNEFKIIPTHPMHYRGDPLEYDEGIDEIDWELMGERDYNDHECREVCMAECIYEGSIPAKAFAFIFVKSEKVKQKVVNLLKSYNLTTRVNVTPGMFKNL
jgi:hypothetical protein